MLRVRKPRQQVQRGTKIPFSPRYAFPTWMENIFNDLNIPNNSRILFTKKLYSWEALECNNNFIKLLPLAILRLLIVEEISQNSIPFTLRSWIYMFVFIVLSLGQLSVKFCGLLRCSWKRRWLVFSGQHNALG